jgi:hypothetical protein
MANPYGYTVALGLEDYVPVLLGALGCWWLTRAAAHRVPEIGRTGALGVALLAAGGASKATWKVLVASAEVEIPLLKAALFPLLAFGFVLVLYAVDSGRRGRVLPWWPVAAALAIAWIGADAVRSVTPFFGLTVAASLTLSVIVIRWAWTLGARWAVAGFALQVLGVLALVPLQDQEPMLSTQWLEQSVNTAGQAAFAAASFVLLGAVRRTSPPASVDVPAAASESEPAG